MDIIKISKYITAEFFLVDFLVGFFFSHLTIIFPGDVMCGKSTTVPINGLTYPVGPGDKFTIKTRKMTRRCVVSYKPANGCTAIRLRCPKFFVPNDDADKCRRGDFMRVKSEQDAIPEE